MRLALALLALCITPLSAATLYSTNGHYYDLVLGSYTWAAASTAATQAGGYLATITTQGEQDFLVTTFGSNSASRWIGASDDANTTDAIFNWVTNEAFSYTNFAAGEPDNDVSSGGFGDALAMQSSGVWFDTNPTVNTFVGGYLVEFNSNPTSVPEPSTWTLAGVGLAVAAWKSRRQAARK